MMAPLLQWVVSDTVSTSPFLNPSGLSVFLDTFHFLLTPFRLYQRLLFSKLEVNPLFKSYFGILLL